MDYNSSSHLLYNDVHKNVKVSYELSLLLNECQSFDFSIAFIAMSGLAALKETLNTLRLNNKKGRIVTSTYLSFNEPKMFEELLKYPNIEVRIYDDKYGFHSKGYLFYNHDGCSAIVGSSNLTQSALSINQEWNVFFNSKCNQEVIEQIQGEFNYQWEHAIPLTKEWIDEYKKIYVKPQRVKPIKQEVIKPNLMQERALSSLDHLRKKGKDKALLISATGTGKTYLSAFDVLKVNPKRMLFVVHRRSIAIKAMETFQSIIPNHTMGLFSGSEKNINVDYIFATIQTMSKIENLQLFDREHFDYIIIDEVHKSGAQTYQTLIQYFKPLFLFGMSATPERSDGFDIYEMFDHNIAYEIRLQQAMEYNLLCPFHYYGITDFKNNGMDIDDKTLFNSLVSEERIDYIIDKINDYGYCGDKVHGLIFVSRKQEAIELSNIFNERGYKTIALTGEDSESVRQDAMNRLESSSEDALDYIITVDIFNEGIDIPIVNQVVMLRPTQSAIIFVQQLGRGLRKHKQKDYVVVIDFIGNYERNFLIPIALSGNTDLNKDTLRQFVCEGNVMIPGCSTIQFDEISKKRIFESIDQANFNEVKLLKESYYALKHKLGRIPRLCEFEQYGAIDVQRIFQNKNLGSYHIFLKKYDKDYTITFTPTEETYLKFISIKLSAGKRIQELEAIKLAIEKRSHLQECLKKVMKDEYQMQLPNVCYETIQNILTQNFATGTGKDTFKDALIINDDWTIHHQFQKLLNNHCFKEQVLEIIDYAINKYQKEYSSRYHDSDLCLYKKYTYEDVCRLLNWGKNIVAQNIGGYKYDENTKTFPVFINYNKADDISDTLKYEDRFIDRNHLISLSKSNRTIHSEDVQKFINASKNDIVVHLFVRKNKEDKISKEFYYLGVMNATGCVKEIVLPNTKSSAVEIEWELDTPVRKDLYDYIVRI